MPSSIWPPYPDTLGLFVQKLKGSSNARAGPKEALDQVYKVDSFIKESQRKTPLGNRECRSSCVCFTLTETVIMMRVACLEGLHIRGWHPYSSRNFSQCQSYTSTSRPGNVPKPPEQFKGFRFPKMRLQHDSKKYDIVATSLATFLPSDTGVMPVLDAYFAACKLKIMLAHTVLNYDVKMENEGVRPADYWLASSCIPNPKGEIMFRKRATWP